MMCVCVCGVIVLKCLSFYHNILESFQVIFIRFGKEISDEFSSMVD